MGKTKIKDIFIKGPIGPDRIARSIASHKDKTDIGAHSLFLGQVREDEIQGDHVIAIEYTAYKDMALEQMAKIRERLIDKYKLSCIHVYHSLGRVETGEICLFVLTSSPHRKEAMAACEACVEAIKNDLPIWGREILKDRGHQWKKNI